VSHSNVDKQTLGKHVPATTNTHALFSMRPLIDIVACTVVAMQPPPRWAGIPGPFLGNGAVNTLPFLGSRFLIMQQLDYNNGRDVFSISSVPICYKEGTRSFDSSVRESVKRGLEPEAEE
jgi:hypothetical protein